MLKRWGVHPTENKLHKPAEIAALPEQLIIPLVQHCGAPAEPLVKEGDKVKQYQKIAGSEENVSASIHAPASGTVRTGETTLPNGRQCKGIIIDTDKEQEHVELEKKDPDKLSAEEMIDKIKEAGIVGMGGAGFPTHVKLRNTTELFILNGCECEPYLSADHMTMLEHPEKVIKGLKIMMRIVGAKNAVLGIENNKKDAAEKLEKFLESNMKIRLLKTWYPQGSEKHLVHAITGRKVHCGKIPCHIGITVNNVATAKAVYDAVYEGIPLTERIVTVTGDLNDPKNLVARIGTSGTHLINECGGMKGNPSKVIYGGPMMGHSQDTSDNPIIKTTGGIIVMDNPQVNSPSACIRCGRCVQVCPMNLMPTTIARYSEMERYNMADQYYAKDCIECGCCAYVCPSKIPLVQLIRDAKCGIDADKG